MRNNPFKVLTAQSKMTGVNSMMGNPAIANQQGTTRVLYDTLPLDGREEFKFFESVQSRTFPMTNLNQNKLQVAESFALQRIYFSIVSFSTGSVTDVLDVTSIQTGGQTYLWGSQFTINWDTMTIVKPIPLASLKPDFNKSALNDLKSSMEFDNNIILPTDIQFRCELDTPPYTLEADTYLRCTWEGFGTILSPKQQF